MAGLQTCRRDISSHNQDNLDNLMCPRGKVKECMIMQGWSIQSIDKEKTCSKLNVFVHLIMKEDHFGISGQDVSTENGGEARLATPCKI